MEFSQMLRANNLPETLSKNDFTMVFFEYFYNNVYDLEAVKLIKKLLVDAPWLITECWDLWDLTSALSLNFPQKNILIRKIITNPNFDKKLLFQVPQNRSVNDLYSVPFIRIVLLDNPEILSCAMNYIKYLDHKQLELIKIPLLESALTQQNYFFAQELLGIIFAYDNSLINKVPERENTHECVYIRNYYKALNMNIYEVLFEKSRGNTLTKLNIFLKMRVRITKADCEKIIASKNMICGEYNQIQFMEYSENNIQERESKVLDKTLINDELKTITMHPSQYIKNAKLDLLREKTKNAETLHLFLINIHSYDLTDDKYRTYSSNETTNSHIYLTPSELSYLRIVSGIKNNKIKYLIARISCGCPI
jgi:hypothetical protein